MIVGDQIITDSNGNRKVYKMIQTEGANQMPDLEIVIKSLRRCSDMTICPADCCYRKYAPDCIERLHKDAIALLKEQDELLEEQEDLGTELTNAVELIHKKNERIEKLLKEQEAVEPVFEVKNPNVVGQFHCGNCHHAFGLLHYKFCPECGRKVKWND